MSGYGRMKLARMAKVCTIGGTPVDFAERLSLAGFAARFSGV